MHLQDAASCSNFAIAGFLFLHFAFTLAVASTACPFFCIVEAFFSCSFYVLYIFFLFWGSERVGIGLEFGFAFDPKPVAAFVAVRRLWLILSPLPFLSCINMAIKCFNAK